MRSLQQQLVAYAISHRQPCNVRCHLLGVPLIMLALAIGLGRWRYGGVPVLPCLLWPLLAVWYLRWAGSLGVLLLLFLLPLGWAGVQVAASALWWQWALLLLLAGVAALWLGHRAEGRQPAFVQAPAALLVGPLFVLLEYLFLLGFYRALHQGVAAAVAVTVAQQKVAAGP